MIPVWYVVTLYKHCIIIIIYYYYIWPESSFGSDYLRECLHEPGSASYGARAMIAPRQTLPSLTLVPGLRALLVVIISGNVYMTRVSELRGQGHDCPGQTLPSLTLVPGLRALLVVIISGNVHMNQGQ